MINAPPLIRTRKAFTLIEAAIVLGVVAIVIGGIWGAASALNESKKVSDTVKGILAICSAANSLLPRSMAPTTSTDVTATLIRATQIPDNWSYNNSTGRLWPPVIEDRSITYSDTQLLWYHAGQAGASGNIGGGVNIWMRQIPYRYCTRILSTSALERAQHLVFYIQTNNLTSSDPHNGILPYTGRLADLCTPLSAETQINIAIVCRPS